MCLFVKYVCTCGTDSAFVILKNGKTFDFVVTKGKICVIIDMLIRAMPHKDCAADA